MWCSLAGLLIACGVSTLPEARAEVVFSNLLPYSGYSYYNGGSGIIGASPYAAYHSLAQAFTLSQTSILNSIDVGLTYNYESYPTSRDVIISLESGTTSSGPNGNVLATGVITASAQFGTTNTTLVAFTPTGSPITLNAGQTYWVVIAPADSTTYDIWGGIQDFGYHANSTDGVNYSVSNGQGNALQVEGAIIPSLYWNGSITSANSHVNGGSGTWDNATTNWTNATGATSANWTPGIAIFSAGSGTVTVGGNVAVNGLNFVSGAGAYTIAVGTGNTLTINGAGISNASGVTQTLVTNVDGNGAQGSLNFTNSATAGSAVITNQGAIVSGAGGTTTFANSSTAGSATITNQGGTASGASGGKTVFGDTATAGSANIVTNGGTNGGGGGATYFQANADGGTASAITDGNGAFDISGLTNGGMKIGSIAGSGRYFLGGNTLTVGGSNLRTAVSGTIADGGQNGGVGGSLVMAGTGALTLSGVNTYTGATTVNGGALVVDGSLANTASVTVNKGGTLAGTGTIGSPVTINPGGTLAHGGGNSVGTITVGTLTLNSGSTVSYQLGVPGSANDLTVVNGNLSLNGSTLDITALSGFGDGTYELFSYTGSLTGTLNLGPLPTGFTAADFSIQTSLAGRVDLIVTGGTGFQLQYWNGSTIAANGSIAGGSGTWDNGRTNWTDGAGTASLSWAQSVAVFSSGGGTSSSPATITLGDNITAGELRFTAGSGAYKISVSPGDTLTVNGVGIRNSSGVAQSFETVVDGSGKYGTLTFSNSATAAAAQITNDGAAAATGNGGATFFNDASTAAAATIANLAGTKPSAAGGTTTFSGTASAGTAIVTNGGADYNGGAGGATSFLQNATAGSASIVNQTGTWTFTSGGSTTFGGNSTAGNATIFNQGSGSSNGYAGVTRFADNSTAGSAIITNEGNNAGISSSQSNGTLTFSNNATAGNATINNNGATANGGAGGATSFSGNTSAVTATITNGGGAGYSAGGGSTLLSGNATADSATIVNQAGARTGARGGFTIFSNAATAASATITNQGGATDFANGGYTSFQDTATAGNAMITNQGLSAVNANTGISAYTQFTGNSSASNATIINQATTVSSIWAGGNIAFSDSATAGAATITNQGATVNGGKGGVTNFRNSSTAGSATIITNGGANGGQGGIVAFSDGADGGTARAVTNGNGMFDISGLMDGGMNIGSIEGSGIYKLGAKTLTVGGNNLSSTVSGVIQNGATGSYYYPLNGSLVKIGTGTLTLSGANTYTGSTTVNQGGLVIDGSLANTAYVVVNDGGTLAGTGTIAGPVTINSGGMLAHGGVNSPGTFAVGSLTLNAGSNVNYQLGAPGVMGGSDLTIVNGNLTLGGTLNFTADAGFAAGTYDLFNYSGTLSGTMGIGTLPAGYVASNFQIRTGTGRVDLIVVDSQYWNGSQSVANGTVDGGSGIWSNADTNWTTADGTTSSTWQGGTAIFGGTPGTVTLSSAMSAQGLVFQSSGYTISGNQALTLTGSSPVISVSAGNTATISAPISASAGLAATGFGTLVLTNSGNSYGVTTVANGTLQIGTASASGSLGGTQVNIANGGTLRVVKVSGNNIAVAIANTLGGVGTLEMDSADVNVIFGPLADGAGQLALTQNGAGATLLENAGNSYTGLTSVNNGILQIGENGVPGSIGNGAVKVASGGRFFVVDLPDALGPNAITNAGATTAGTGGGVTSFFNITSAGTATIINQGGAVADTLTQTNGGVTSFRNSSSAGYASIINQSGTAANAMGGVVQFSDSATAGAAQITNQGGSFAGQHGAGAAFVGNSTAGNAVIINQGSTVAGAPSGLTEFDGSATGGSATVTSQGASVSGGTGGITLFTAGSTAGNATIHTDGGSNGGGGGGTYFTGTADGGMAQAITNGNGVFDISGLTNGGMKIGSISGSGTYYLGGKTLTVGGNGLSTTISGVIADGGQAGGTGGSLVVTGATTLVLAGQNTYTGATTINSGTLVVNGSLAAGGVVTVNAGGTLAGTGTIGGAVTVMSGGQLNPGGIAAPGTLTLGSLTIQGAAATTNFRLGQAEVVGGSSNDFVIVNGALALGGNLAITELAGFTPGTYTLFTYTGPAVTSTFSKISGVAGYTTALSTSGGVVRLTIGYPGGAQYWDGAGTANDGTIAGGSGTWNGTASNWADLAGSNNASWGGGSAVFSAAGGTATLASAVSVQGLYFNSGGYTIGGSSTLTLARESTSIHITNAGSMATISAPIAGSGMLSADGAGTLVLTNGANSYSGGTTISTGTLQVGTTSVAGSLGSGAVNINGGGTLNVANVAGGILSNDISNTVGGLATLKISSGNTTFSGALTDSGSPGTGGSLALTQTGFGTFTVLTNPNNSYSGGTTISSGAVQVGDANNASSLGSGPINLGGTLMLVNVVGNNVANSFTGSGTLTFNSAKTLTISGQLSNGSGVLSLFQNGSGTTILANPNGSYYQATVTNGTLQLGTASAAAPYGYSLPVAISNGAALTVVNVANNAFPNDVTGSGKLNFSSANTLVAGGTLNDGAGGTLAVNQNGSGRTILPYNTYGGGYIGGGVIIIIGGGGGNPPPRGYLYSGPTNVNAGILEVDGTIANSAVTVHSGGTLAGTGNIATSATILAGGTLAPGTAASPGTLVFNNLVLDTGAISTFRLGAVNAPGDSVTAANLTLAGSLNVIPLPGFGAGIYPLFSYNGGFTNNGVNVQGLAGYSTSIIVDSSSATAGIVELLVSAGLVQYWDGAGAVNDGIISGGNGTWNSTAKSWTDATGAANAVWGGGTALFRGPGGTVTLGSALTAQGLIFGSDGYVLSGSALTLSLAGAAINVSSAGTSATISAPIAGTVGLTANGPGTLVLTSAANSYTGATTVLNGTLQIGKTTTAAKIPAGSAIDLGSGGTLTIVNVSGNALPNSIANNIGGVGTVNIASTNTVTISGVLTETGQGQLALTQSGSGTTILTSPGNTYSGITTISKGTLQIGTATAAGSMGASTPVSVGGGATLALLNVYGSWLPNAIFNDVGGTGTVSVRSSSSLVLGGNLTDGIGQLALTQSGAGKTVLSGSDSYTGLTTVSTGTLQIGDGTSGYLSGTGAINVSGTAILAVDMANGASLLKTITLSSAGAKLQAIQPGTNTLIGVISGTGLFIENSSGKTILSANETYTGATNVTAGTLEVNGSLAAASVVNVATGGILAGAGTIKGRATVTGNGVINLGANGHILGTLTVTGGNWNGLGSVGGVVTASSGAFKINGNLLAAAGLNVTGGTLGGVGTLSGNLNYTSLASSTFGGIVTGSSSTITMNRAGATLTLNNNNAFTGTAKVLAGTLQIGDGATGNLPGSSPVVVSGSGVLATDLAAGATFDRNVALSGTTATLKTIQVGTNTLSGIISGTGTFNQNGIGTTILNETETYTGATKVTTGTLEVDGSLAAASVVNIATAGKLTGTGTINGRATLTGNGIADFDGHILGTLAVTGGNWNGAGTVGGLVTSSSGIFTLNGNLNATAGLSVTGGSLGGIGTLTGNLTYASATSSTFGGILAGNTVTMNKASSTLTLTGANTYTGGTKITAGTLMLGNGTASGATLGSGKVTISSGATLGLNLRAGETFANDVTDNGHITDSAATGQHTFSGAISGTGNFIKTGGGAVALTAANTFTGGAIVSGGALLASNATGSATGTGAVTINSGGVLGGSGTVSGAITLNSGGTIAPSAGTPGTGGTTLHATSLMWKSGGTLSLQLGPTGDELVMTGALTRSGTGPFILDLIDADLTAGSYTLLTFGSTNFTPANFTLELPAGYSGSLVETSTSLSVNLSAVATSSFVSGGTLIMSESPAAPVETPKSIDFSGGALTRSEAIATPSTYSPAVTFVPTPEPGSATLLAFGGVALLGWRRRRG